MGDAGHPQPLLRNRVAARRDSDDRHPGRVQQIDGGDVEPTQACGDQRGAALAGRCNREQVHDIDAAPRDDHRVRALLERGHEPFFPRRAVGRRQHR